MNPPPARSPDYEYAPTTTMEVVSFVTLGLSYANECVSCNRPRKAISELREVARYADMLHEFAFRDRVIVAIDMMTTRLDNGRLGRAYADEAVDMIGDLWCDILRKTDTRWIPSSQSTA